MSESINSDFEKFDKALSYDPLTGEFIRKVSSIRLKSGSLAGSKDHRGYVYIRVDYKKFCAHRVAWLLSYGSWPTDQIDHINRIKDDNRLSNLRVVTKSQNQWNRSASSNNKSGFKGVLWSRGRWVSRIVVHGKTISLGTFKCKLKAHDAYCAAADKFHGEFANHEKKVTAI